MALPKKVAWPVFFFLVCLDALITYLVGNGQGGSLLWRPLVAKTGFLVIFILLPLVFAFFYLIVKLAGWFLEKFDKLPKGEEMILTSLIIVYTAYDLYLAFFPYPLSYYILIPILLIPGLIYGFWLEYLRARGKRRVKKT